MRVLLISVDGMRPDAVVQNTTARSYIERAVYSMKASSVMPSVTLPCHMSMFHSVDPGRHGTTTNYYMPQVRPIKGLFDVLAEAKKKCAFFYNWEQLRDLSRPGSLSYSFFCAGRTHGYEEANNIITDCAIEYIGNNNVDFTFLYLGYLDEAGHAFGWMSEEYMKALDNSWRNIDRIVKTLHEDYVVIVTSDHGGHDRSHGTEMPEDMTVPFIAFGKGIEEGKEISDVSIMDVPPTVSSLLGVNPDEDWEGKNALANKF